MTASATGYELLDAGGVCVSVTWLIYGAYLTWVSQRGAAAAPPPSHPSDHPNLNNSGKENNMSKTSKSTAFLLALLAAGYASAQSPKSAVDVPEKLRPGANESLAMIVPAKGVQIYECRARKDQAGGYEWAFVAPEADLFDAGGHRVGRHFAGPHWESNDGSMVAGTTKERADARAADSIPWLLLSAKSVGPEGSFGKVTSIQRVNTVGGAAPKAGCSQATVGTPARVTYTADYYFFTTRQSDSVVYDY